MTDKAMTDVPTTQIIDERTKHPLYVTKDVFDTPCEGLRQENWLPTFDDYIEFDDKLHAYFFRIGGQLVPLKSLASFTRVTISSTGFYHQFFPEFDADDAIAKMRRGRKWNRDNKYWGMTDDEIKALWEANRDAAASAGTRMHELIEWFYEYPTFVTEAHLRYMASAFDMPELLQFLNFHHQVVLKNKWKPFRTELRAFSPPHNLAGSVDMIFIAEDGKLVIVDWKRSKEIRFENRYQKGCGPLAHLDDCNFVHYSLQLNLYDWMMRTYIGIDVAALYLAVFHPNQPDYQVIQVPPMRMEIEAMLEQRLHEEQARALELCRKANRLLTQALVNHGASLDHSALLAEVAALSGHLLPPAENDDQTNVDEDEGCDPGDIY